MFSSLSTQTNRNDLTSTSRLSTLATLILLILINYFHETEGRCNDTHSLGFPKVWAAQEVQQKQNNLSEPIVTSSGNGSRFLNLPETGQGPVGQLDLNCMAKYPVQWTFFKYQIWISWQVTTTRIPGGLELGANDTFLSTLTFPTIRNVSQLRENFPTCHKAGNDCLQTTLKFTPDGERKRLRAVEGSDLVLNPESEFGLNKGCNLVIAYDQESRTFYCQSLNSSIQATIFPRTCSDPIDCARSLMRQDPSCPLQNPTIPFRECRTAKGCYKMTYAPGFLPSVAVCLIRGSEDQLSNSVGIPYFYSLELRNFTSRKSRSFIAPEQYLTWTDADPHKLIEISQFPSEFYVGQTMRFDCNQSYYYFAAGAKIHVGNEHENFPFHLPDLAKAGNVTYADADAALPLPLHFNVDTESSIIYYKTNGRAGQLIDMEWIRLTSAPHLQFPVSGKFLVACLAPVWNSTKWVEKSTVVNVQEPVAPLFPSGNKTEVRYYQNGQSITCLSTGVPKPELSWSFNGGILNFTGVSFSHGENASSVWSALTLQSKAGIFGNFTCKAKNFGGEISKTWVIIPSDKTSSTLLIALGIMGCLALLLIPSVIFLSMKVSRQGKRLSYLTKEEVEEFLLGRPDYIPFQCDMSTYAYYLPYDDKVWEIDKSDLELDYSKILGQGAYGLVLHGRYKKDREVAIKTTKPLDSSVDLFKALLSELKIMTYIGHHPNVVNLVGACTENIRKNEVYIALEFCEFGSLLAFMRTHRHTFINPGFVPDNGHAGVSRQPSFLQCPQVHYVKMEDLSQIHILNPHDYANTIHIKRMDLFQWAWQVAEGMCFLASKKVIHGDLAARNILLTKGMTAKICDFGLSKRLLHYTSYTRTATTPLPIKWLAIECLQDFQFCAESDIWSYGVLIWEIFSLGEIPYASFNGTGEEFLEKISRGMRLGKPMYCDENVFDVMLKCWRHERKQRPKFQMLSKYFKKCLDSNLTQTDNAHRLEMRLSELSMIVDANPAKAGK